MVGAPKAIFRPLVAHHEGPICLWRFLQWQMDQGKSKSERTGVLTISLTVSSSDILSPKLTKNGYAQQTWKLNFPSAYLLIWYPRVIRCHLVGTIRTRRVYVHAPTKRHKAVLRDLRLRVEEQPSLIAGMPWLIGIFISHPVTGQRFKTHLALTLSDLDRLFYLECL